MSRARHTSAEDDMHPLKNAAQSPLSLSEAVSYRSTSDQNGQFNSQTVSPVIDRNILK
jgi:hypothetical protein